MAPQANDFTNLTFRKEYLELDHTRDAYEKARNTIETLTGAPAPEREEYTLEDTISTLTNTQTYEKEFREALLAGDTKAARNAYQAATTAKALSQEFTVTPTSNSPKQSAVKTQKTISPTLPRT